MYSTDNHTIEISVLDEESQEEIAGFAMRASGISEGRAARIVRSLRAGRVKATLLSEFRTEIEVGED